VEFDNPEVLITLWYYLVVSYAVDALMAEEAGPSEFIIHDEQCKGFLKKIEKSLEPPVKAPGSGFDVGINGEDISGSVSFDSGRLVHLTAMIK
jgi:hypothetical protein